MVWVNPARRHEIAGLIFFFMFPPVLGFALPCISYHNQPSICSPILSKNWKEELPFLTDLLFPSVKWVSVPESVEASWSDLIPPVRDEWMERKDNTLHGRQERCHLNIVHSLSAVGSFTLKAAKWIGCFPPMICLKRRSVYTGQKLRLLLMFGYSITTLWSTLQLCDTPLSVLCFVKLLHVDFPFVHLPLFHFKKKTWGYRWPSQPNKSDQLVRFCWQVNWRLWPECACFAFLGLQGWCWRSSEGRHAGHLSKNWYVPSGWAFSKTGW